MQNIVLIGMPGAGKSTVGVLLAKSMLMQFCDTDLVIQQQCKMSLCDIIAQNGIADFIATENRIVSGLTFENCVVATGGSVVYGEQAMQNLRKNGTVVYLQVDPDELENRICNIKTRGIAMKEGTTIAQLYAERAHLYAQYADVTINCTHMKPEECVDRIVEQLKQ